MKFPKVFVSYCWNNSLDAIKKGTRQVPGSVGYGDPRKIKEFLSENGVSCWMDVERVGQVSVNVTERHRERERERRRER